jgi:hypothetical protein
MEKTMLKLLAMTALILASLSPLQGAETDVWTPIRFMLGEWKGTSHGEPGEGTVQRSYALVLGGKFIQEKNVSTYPPQERNKSGERHEHLSMFGFDKDRKLVTFRQFHQESFVVTYVMNVAVSTTTKVVFESEHLENVPSSWKARETYVVLSANEFVETFEIAEAGGKFETYSQNRFRRVVQ